MIDGPLTVIRLFHLCDNMRWNHLPEPGGLYAQHPDLLDQFSYIFAERSKYEAEQQKKREKEQEAERRKSMAKGGSRGGSRPRRR